MVYSFGWFNFMFQASGLAYYLIYLFNRRSRPYVYFLNCSYVACNLEESNTLIKRNH